MSAFMTVFAVPIERIKQVVGSRDEAMLKQIIAHQADYLSGIDEIDEDCGFQCAQALADLVNDRLTEGLPSYLYGYAVMALCHHFGEALPGIPSIAGAHAWIGEIDEALEEQSFPIKLASLLYSGSPIRIPQADEYPVIGFVPASDIPAAIEKMASLGSSGLDHEVTEVAEQILGWLKAANKRSGMSLVGCLSY